MHARAVYTAVYEWARTVKHTVYTLARRQTGRPVTSPKALIRLCSVRVVRNLFLCELARHRSCRVFVPYPGTFSMCRSASFHALEFGTLSGIKRKIMKMNYLPCSLAESCPHLDGAYPNCATAKSCSWINTTLRSITLGLLFSA